MNNCHLGILEIYQVDIRNIHYPWYIDGIREISQKYTLAYTRFFAQCCMHIYTSQYRSTTSMTKTTPGACSFFWSVIHVLTHSVVHVAVL